MKHQLFCIFDNKASYFLPPWPCRNVGTARREFLTACQTPKMAFSEFPADYVLYAVGEFDDADAKFTPFQPPQRVCDGVEILQMAGRPTLPAAPASSPTEETNAQA